MFLTSFKKTSLLFINSFLAVTIRMLFLAVAEIATPDKGRVRDDMDRHSRFALSR